MDATLYTGNSSTQNVVNAGRFQPDLVWIKDRTNAVNHQLYDSVRGVSVNLHSNTTGADTTTTGFGVTAFTSIGPTIVDSSANYGVNYASDAYVAWQWQAGQGSTSTNTAGTITTTTSVNTTAGFSVFTFTGTGASSASVGHGLGVAPKFMIFKQRNGTSNWNVLTNAGGSNQYGFLNLTTAFAAAGETWTSTVINIGANFTNGSTYVCYAWAEIAGFSKFGSYTGNGVNGNGPFVFCGFRPKFVLFKNTNTTQDWIIMDTARDTKNKMTQWLSANTSGAEYTDANIDVDFVSNGFKIRTSIGTELNGNGNTIIYAAFAENPFKNSNAR
jgi:hypothetical protein